MNADAPQSPDQLQPRLSMLAIAGVLCALGAMAGCALTIFTFATGGRFVTWVVISMPVLGLLALSLGGTAHAMIRRARGGLWGRELATAAVVMGLGSLVIGGAFVGTGIARYLSLRDAVAPALTRLIQNLDADPARARETLSDKARDELTDDRLIVLSRRLKELVGDGAIATVDVNIFRLSNEETERAKARGAFGPGSPQTVGDPPLPIEIAGSRGRAFAWVILDQDALRSRKLILVDDLLVMVSAGDGITLRPAGRGRTLADFMAVTVKDLPMFLPGPEGASASPPEAPAAAE